MTHTRPTFWAGLTGAVLLVITAGAYYYWYQVLVARGYGYMYNAMKYQTGFALTRFCLFVALCVGCATYELTRQRLSKLCRSAYLLLLGFGIALFAVHWIVLHFAVAPFWHHP
jgi:hypothetical protein